MAMTWASGADGKATFGATTLNIQGWTYSEAGSDGDTTNTGGAGVETVLNVTTAYTGTIEGVWDTDASPTTSPNLRRGQTGSLVLYVSATKSITVAVRILSFDVTSAVKDVIKYSCSWQSTAAPSAVPA
jgi:hypothetical protein